MDLEVGGGWIIREGGDGLVLRRSRISSLATGLTRDAWYSSICGICAIVSSVYSLGCWCYLK